MLDGEDHTGGGVFMTVDNLDCQVIFATGYGDVEQIVLIPVVSSTDISSIEPHFELIVGSDSKGSILETVGMENRLESSTVSLRPISTSVVEDPLSSTALIVGIVGSVVRFQSNELTGWRENDGVGRVGEEEVALGESEDDEEAEKEDFHV